jgi:Carboxypeptidase regulatory-like domain
MSQRGFSRLLLCTSLILLTSSYAWCQDSALKGTVRDAANNQAISGTDVRVEDSPGTVVGRSITDANGRYNITGLQRGSHVTAYYSRGGYVPYPRGPEEVVLSGASNTKNIQLLRNTRDASYWTQLSEKVRTAVDASTTDKAQQLEHYQKIWLWLGASGLSTSAQGQAARGFVAIAPELLRSTELESFASVDADSLEKAEADLRAAVDGQIKLSNPYSLPPDVAVAIAASELRKRKGSDPEGWSQFSNDFQRVWGKSAEQDLQIKLVPTYPRLANDSVLEKNFGVVRP